MKKDISSSLSHDFAFYVDSFSNHINPYSAGQKFEIKDLLLWSRISTVIRMKVGKECTFFDRKVHALCSIIDLSKKGFIEVLIISKSLNKTQSPCVTYAIPLLKKDAFEKALYALVEVGVTCIQPIVTEKTHRKKITEKEAKRYKKIIIAAAEQSKNFRFPVLEDILSLDDFIDSVDYKNSHCFYFDFLGNSLLQMIDSIKNKKVENIYLIAGPEGDLTLEEKEKVKDKGFYFTILTSTVLRSWQAISLSSGIFRSIF